MKKIRKKEVVEKEIEVVRDLCGMCKEELVTIDKSRNFDGSEYVLVKQMWAELCTALTKLQKEERR